MFVGTLWEPCEVLAECLSEPCGNLAAPCRILAGRLLLGSVLSAPPASEFPPGFLRDDSKTSV